MSWADSALCANQYGPAFDRMTDSDQVAACFHCDVRETCLTDALEVERRMPCQPSGVRGGLTGRMRSKIIHKERQAAEQRKAAAA